MQRTVYKISTELNHPSVSSFFRRALLVLILLAGWGSSVVAQNLDLMPYLRNGGTWGGYKTNNGDGSVNYTSQGEWQGVIANNMNINLSEYEKVVVEFSNTVNNVQVVVMNGDARLAETGLRSGVSSIECSLVNANVSSVSHIAIQPQYNNTTFTITALYAVPKAAEPSIETLAANINDPNLKTKYKTISYTNNNGTLTFTPQLLTNWYEVAGDCDASRQDFANNGYVRWFLLNTTDNSIITDMRITANNAYTNTNAYGYYRYQFAQGNLDIDGSDAYNPTFQVQLNGVSVDQVRLVCVASTLTDAFATDRTTEPNLQVKYVYNLKTVNEIQNEGFVHYQGETHRDYQTVNGSSGPQEKSWNNGVIENVSQNIRQSVHQVDYYIYLDKQPGDYAELALPLEGWSDRDNDNPSGTEPLGFYRWYDWNTDCNNTQYLEKIGSMLDDTNHGFICNWISNRMARNNGQWPWTPQEKFRNLIGVDFKVPQDFANMDEVVIACDVSRYMDGLDDSKRYLVHEPTLSIRYLFHVRPAKKIADEIDEKSKYLRALEDGSMTVAYLEENNLLDDLFKLYEDNGRVVVSLNDTEGQFALRVNLKELGHYFINGQNLVQGSQLKWYAYYQDENGDIWKHAVNMDQEVPMTGYVPENQDYYVNNKKRYQLRMAKYEVSEFLGQAYEKVGSNDVMTLETLPPGASLHVVGCIGDGTVEKPVSSYDLVFLDAGPKALGNETTQVEQTYATELNVGAVLTFDDLFSEDETIRLAKPTSSAENYAQMPQKWPLGQYGYCYPSLYGQDASSWAIYHSWWNGYGIGPTHGDYMLLKSMNMLGVSYTAGSSGDANGTFDTQSYYAWWYSNSAIDIGNLNGTPAVFPQLFDVTHERQHGKELGGADAQYGTYMYIDASDEARTYANLEFKAKLCAGAQIYYTAYIANMAPNVGLPANHREHKAPPQVMFRVTTEVNGERIPVVSFLTGDIESMGADELGQWYMVSGHTKIPSELEYLLNGGERTYYVSIDNFAENTKGADYCVDEITFYTTSAKVKAYVASDRCTTDKGVKVKVYAEAQSLLKALGDGREKNLFYRIYKMHDSEDDLEENEALTGHDVYSGGQGPTNDQYGTVRVKLNVNLENVPASGLWEGNTEGSGYYRDGEEVYFQFVDRTFELEPGQAYFVSFYDFDENRVGPPSGWGSPYGNNTCSVYSNKFYSNKVFLQPWEAVTGQEASGKIDLACGETEVDVTYDLKLRFPKVDGTYAEYNNVHFDYFVGRVDWTDNDPTDDDPNAQVISAAKFSEVKAAVDALRTITTVALSHDEMAEVAISGDFTQEMKDLLLSYMLGPDEHNPHRYPRLLLEASTQFKYTFTAPNGNYFQAIPIEKTTEENGEGEDICDQIELMFYVDDSSGGPKISLGFDDVDYPDNYKKQVVRVGLEQLRKMKYDGYKLHIPVRSLETKNNGPEKRVFFPSDGAQLTLSAVSKTEQVPATTDPVLAGQASAVGQLFAKIVPSKFHGNDRAFVDRDHMFLPLDLKDCEIDFHEGYEYEVSTSFLDEAEEYEEKPCYSDLYLVIKVVPEFVTWDAHQIGNTEYYSANWYNDENWKRSTRAQLYKDQNEADAQQNTPTPGHPEGYDNDGEGTLAELTGELYNENPNPGYVPMKFTHVTLLTGNHAPNLIKEVRVEATNGRSAASQGGSLIDPSYSSGTEMLTDTSPFTDLYASYPTQNIRYDMMVRYGAHANGGEGCFGHRRLHPNGSWDDFPQNHQYGDYDHNKVFDVEKFYGNTCKDIYFKPGAELLRQQRLYYQKAWVEKELNANTWSLVSTPLKSTYAGDMYVPTKMTDVSLETPAEVDGRQVTEAFQPMNFSTTAVAANRENKVTSQPAYSRTKYPIYQRSWDNNGSWVWTKTNDMRANHYSADLKYSSVTTNFVEWSHTYNDVQEPYHTLTGFSIRPYKQDQTLPSLIRLPKDDTSYQYFDWTDTGSDPAGGQHTVDKSAVQELTYYYGDTNPHQELSMYRLKVDDPADDGDYKVNVSDLQQQDGYLLVGNPTMASIDMSKFFAKNTDLALGYWTYDNGNVVTYTVTSTSNGDGSVSCEVTPSTGGSGGIIKPLQAFFVKKGNASEIHFTRGMTVDGNFPGDVVVPAPSRGARPFGIVMSAAGVRGSSSALVTLSDDASDDYIEGEDMETLFDSNLSDVPMVYTVAGGQAVSIDKRPQIDLVPFGVSCAESDEMVEVNVNSSLFTLHSSLLYIIDAVTGSVTEVGEGSTYQVQPNDYGRYFLTTRSDMTAIREATAEGGIVVSVRQRQLTVRAASDLKSVRVMKVGGETVASATGTGSEVSFSLKSSGVYIVEAQTENDSKTMKVIVK